MGVRRHMGYGRGRRNNGATKAWGEESAKAGVGTKRSRGSRCLGWMGDGLQDKESNKEVLLFAFTSSRTHGFQSVICSSDRERDN